MVECQGLKASVTKEKAGCRLEGSRIRQEVRGLSEERALEQSPGWRENSVQNSGVRAEQQVQTA